MLIMVVILLLGLIIVCFALYSVQQQVQYVSPMIQAVENAKDILYYCETKPRLRYRYLSPAVDHILGPHSLEEHINNPYYIYEIVHPDDYHIYEKKEAGEIDFNKPIVVRLRDYQNRYIWFEEYATPIYENGEVVAVFGIYRNIDDKVKLQRQLQYKISHDSLTDLYNRDYFECQMKKYDKEEDVSIAIVICDLDELKFINDHYGHMMGDQLIKETAALLKECTSENVIAARIGGDEFAIMLIDADPLHIEVFLAKLQEKIALFNSSSDLLRIKMSKGYANHESSIGKMGQLFVEADDKMYEEKNKKKINRYTYNPTN